MTVAARRGNEKGLPFWAAQYSYSKNNDSSLTIPPPPPSLQTFLALLTCSRLLLFYLVQAEMLPTEKTLSDIPSPRYIIIRCWSSDDD